MSSPTETSTSSPCSQEKGDTRVFLHIKDMVDNGVKKLKTVDMDVIIVGTSLFNAILSLAALSFKYGTWI